jgi:aldose 1-epimerase
VPVLAALLLILVAAGCQTAPTTVEQSVRVGHGPWGRTPDGKAVDLTTLRNTDGIEVRIATLGGTIVSLRAPDRAGQIDDVVLGYDDVAQYVPNPTYFGCLVGRYANRIAGGRFTLEDQTYTLAQNNGPNHLHGGRVGWNQAIWHAEPFQNRSGVGVVLTHTSPDGDEGYPGTVTAEVTYTLTDRNDLRVDYRATTDKPTIINLTQHSYFNLAGTRANDVLGHELMINADRFTAVDETLIPTGELASVEGTPFDFRTAHAIGARIAESDVQLQRGRGYDHNFVLNRPENVRPKPDSTTDETPTLAARVFEPTTGRTLEIATSEPGLQFYSGNFLDGTIKGKGGRVYGPRGGFCLETQHFPDSPNHANFPSTVLRPGQQYRSTSVYSFGVRR